MLKVKSKYLCALGFLGTKGFNCQTILVSALDEQEAISIVSRIKPNRRVTDIKKVDY